MRDGNTASGADIVNEITVAVAVGADDIRRSCQPAAMGAGMGFCRRRKRDREPADGAE